MDKIKEMLLKFKDNIKDFLEKTKTFFYSAGLFIKKQFFNFLKLSSLKKIIIIIFLGVFIFVLSKSSLWIEAIKYKSVNIQEYHEEFEGLEPGIQLDYVDKDSLVAENTNFKMYINTNTTRINIVDKSTNKSWQTSDANEPVDLSLQDDELLIANERVLVGEELNQAQSNIILEYITLQKKYITINSYQHAVTNHNVGESRYYIVEQINNGVRINYNIGKTEITQNHFPAYLTVERYEQYITNNDFLTEEDKAFMAVIYRKVSNSNYHTLQSLTAKNRIYAYEVLYTKGGYTTEDLNYDNDLFGIETPDTSFAQFFVVLEVRLTFNGIDVSVPTQVIQEPENFSITSISVLPYLGGEKIHTNGYMFVPDGSGALIDFDSFKTEDYIYNKQVYNNDLLSYTGFSNYYSYSEEITMPVFGVANLDEEKAVIGIIESGGEIANIYASSSKYLNHKYNRVYSKFSPYIIDSIGLYGTYDTNKVRIQSEKMVQLEYKVKYIFLTGDKANYYGMAKQYQKYLIEKYDLDKIYQDNAKINLEIVGSVSILDNIVGIPYQRDYALTTYSQIKTISEDMLESNINFDLIISGWMNNGLNQTSASKLNLISSMKDDVSFKQLNTYFYENNINVTYAANILKVYGNNKNGFIRNSHSTRVMDNSVYKFYKYSLASNEFDTSTEEFYYLSPKYIQSISNILNNKISDYEISNITLNDLGLLYTADYHKSNFIDPIKSRKMVIEGLNILNKNHLTLRNPFDYALKNSDYIIDINYESSNYYIFSNTIPFKQLVYNDLINYSLGNSNNGTASFSEITYLKALETGADLKYLLTFNDTSYLAKTEYNYLNATYYQNWKDEIISYYERLNEFVQTIGSRIIIKHEILQNCVYKVTYQTNKEVIFNYNSYPVIIDGIEIPKIGMKVIN